MRKAKISHEDAVYWSSPHKQWESSRCIVLIVDPTPSSLANPFMFKRLVPWGIQCWFRCLWQFGFNAASRSERARRVERTEKRKTWLKKTMKSVAAKRRGRYSTETVGEIETRPFGNDSVATAGLLPWLTHGR